MGKTSTYAKFLPSCISFKNNITKNATNNKAVVSPCQLAFVCFLPRRAARRWKRIGKRLPQKWQVSNNSSKGIVLYLLWSWPLFAHGVYTENDTNTWGCLGPNLGQLCSIHM